MEENSIVRKNMRFVKDYNLPINIFNEEMFSYYRELYKDFWPYEAEKQMNKEISAFSGNIDKWLESYANLRDRIIETLENSEEYKEFNTCDLHMYDIPDLGIGEHNLYNQENDNKFFLSVDLKKANFQALKYVDVILDNTYEDFIMSFYGGTKYFADSKYLRQVIFGKLNPKRQIKVEKYLMAELYRYLTYYYSEYLPTLYSFNSDELVFSIKNDTNVLTYKQIKEIEKDISVIFGIDVRVELVKINRIPIVNSNGATVDAYIRKNVYTNEETLKKASTTFFPQIYKIYKGMEINELDKKFFFEGQIATFDNELKLNK